MILHAYMHSLLTLTRLGFQYAMEHGAATEASYPYKGRDEACDLSKMKMVENVTGESPHPPFFPLVIQ